MGRAAGQVVTTNPQKSADAIVVIALKLVGEDEIERSVALMRFIAPKCTLHFAGGRARLSTPATARILRGGMNGALVGDMLTTVGNNVEEDFKLFKSVGYEK